MIKRKGWERILPEGWKEKIKEHLCPVCDKKHNRPFNTCSPKCNQIYHEKSIINDFNKIKNLVWDRDNGRCCKCGKSQVDLIHEAIEKDHPILELEYDHKFPVCLGGEEFNPNNCQLLCKKCHQEKTKKDMKLIAQVRKQVKVLGKGKSLEKYWFIK